MHLGIVVLMAANLLAIIGTFLFLHFSNQKSKSHIIKQAKILRRKQLLEKYRRNKK